MFIYITGVDGTGKSTQTTLLLDWLNLQGVKVRRVWLRYPQFFSLPFLAYARFRGMSWREQNGDVVHGYWDFRGSWLMERIYPWVLLVDTVLATIWKIYLPLLMGYALVCERYVLDMLADLGGAIGDESINRLKVGKLLLKLIPDDSVIICLDLDASQIWERRPDLTHDKALENKLSVYRAFAEELDLHVLSSEAPVDTVHQNLLGLIYEFWAN